MPIPRQPTKEEVLRHVVANLRMEGIETTVDELRQMGPLKQETQKLETERGREGQRRKTLQPS